MSEVHIRNSIMSWVIAKGGLIFIHDSVGIYDPVQKCFRRRHGVNRRLGVSDLLGIWKGKFLAIEVKSPKGQLTLHQTRFLNEVNQQGGIAFMARSIEDVILAFKNKGLL